MADAIRTETLKGAYVQENGIIRLADGRYIGRLDDIAFDEIVAINSANQAEDGLPAK